MNPSLRLAGRILSTAAALALTAGGLFLFSLVIMALVHPIGGWGAFVLGVGGFLGFACVSAYAALRLGPPRFFLVGATLGVLLALSPFLLLQVYGDWSAEFVMQLRLRHVWVSIADFARFAIPVGITAGVVCLVAYLRVVGPRG